MNRRGGNRDDDDEDDGKKDEQENTKIPKPLFPPRKDIPPIPNLDNPAFEPSFIYKQRFRMSVYQLKPVEVKKDKIDRYSQSFTSSRDTGQSLENSLPLHSGYFPTELTVTKRKKRKSMMTNVNKTLDGLQNLENQGEEEEEVEEDEEESDMEDEEYARGEDMDDDEDISVSGGEEEGTF
ncbi:hypothetical protein DFA_03423 [Cavenderia fasciculata]|uniref:DNA-directed RNA polymerase III subunit n=1 Tax=Cavenderia fasciculata TaxID=261658 RepID=F4PHJ1_CACFS|nr:uncharacterized protein DFA_03423 [Cavenderia fasciculata]EGG25175.1 hypothetical protein DFA_03423 [Cavenderia fasciculata]|eukprot:XP_004363026.1 hypothetical protein DFA_03423 [Cavenderia fasciculata]